VAADLRETIEAWAGDTNRPCPPLDETALEQFIQDWRENLMAALFRLSEATDDASSEVEPTMDAEPDRADPDEEASDSQDTAEFVLDDEDRFAIHVAKKIANRLLADERTTQQQIAALNSYR
jgi:hypothetical protein